MIRALKQLSKIVSAWNRTQNIEKWYYGKLIKINEYNMSRNLKNKNLDKYDILQVGKE